MADKLKRLTESYQKAKSGFSFFDSNCWVGRRAFPEFNSLYTVDGLIKEMAFYGIEKAVVTHTMSVDYDPRTGNEQLAKDIEGRENLYGAISLLPEGTGELGDIEEYIDDMLKRKIVIARIFPKSHTFSLGKWSSDSLFKALEERKMPLCLWHSETSWGEIYNLCSAYPNLPVIVEGTGRKILYDNRLYYPILKRCPNLYLELHNVVNHAGVDRLVADFGGDRLIFGTYMPIQDPNTTIMQVAFGDFPLQEKAKIAGGNLRGMLDETKI
jgi:predicted TIM-barrel fold metal-dependent hydrolase